MKIKSILTVGPAEISSVGKPLSERYGCEWTQAASVEEVQALVKGGKVFELALLSLEPAKLQNACRDLRSAINDLIIVAIAPEQDAAALEAVRRGDVADLLPPATSPAALEASFLRAVALRGALAENEYHRALEIDPNEELVGRSEKMREICRVVDKIVNTGTPVLLSGETGCGKDILARYIHRRSSRSRAPFVRVDCAGFPEIMLERELFGRDLKATLPRRRAGRLELAESGTLVLNDIETASGTVQAELLRLLSEWETREDPSRPRLICTTRANLSALAAEEKFNAELWRRLLPVPIPPLRERENDVIMLAEYFLRRFVTVQARGRTTLDTSAKQALTRFSWPVNVRELAAAIERALLTSSDGVITAQTLDLTALLSAQDAQAVLATRPATAAPPVTVPTVNAIVESSTAPPAAPAEAVAFITNTTAPTTMSSNIVPAALEGSADRLVFEVGQPLSDVEKEMILRTVALMKGNRTRAAKILGISVRTLYTKLLEYGEKEEEEEPKPVPSVQGLSGN